MVQIDRSYSDINSELQRYEQIISYYRDNPLRIEPNKSYLRDVKDRLVEISRLEEMPKKLLSKNDELLNSIKRLEI